MGSATYYDRAAITRRAHAIRKQHGVDFSTAMRAAWAEAKSSAPLIVRGQEKRVAYIDACAQPSGVAAALRRYGVDIEAASIRAADFVRRLTETLHAATLRREANIAALRSGARVLDAAPDAHGVFVTR